MKLKDNILNGKYDNKLPFSPATINLDLYNKYIEEEERLKKIFINDFIKEFKPNNQIIQSLQNDKFLGGYLYTYEKYINMINTKMLA